ncbi:NADH dehydrogenase [ubiquinone] 1 beta subcomplex subunit 7-like [Tubulanus polymorphus]|uniref:NADH dehydrogenase [ubiquinone] 1 beta subcomplex subunit 7-like n=1 Tax=Tubulanus polymorphus TaxID=672921 RepID=UPI003DA30B9F
MGQWYSSYISHPDTTPNYKEEPTFDAMYGFPNGRKERVCIASYEEMQAANLPLDKRDYCAHLYIDFMRCKKENMPWNIKCKHELHEWETCQHNDFIMRMKEFEREKRLLERAKRKALKESTESLDE